VWFRYWASLLKKRDASHIGVGVCLNGFVASPLVLGATVLFAGWALLMAFVLWRESGRASGADITA
jgi:hypothetical protein